MGRKRTSQRGAAKASECSTACTIESKPVSFTLEQALAELDRLTPWSRSLPICKTLLQNEISRLRADGNMAKATADDASVKAEARAAQAAPSGPLSRESSASEGDKNKATTLSVSKSSSDDTKAVVQTQQHEETSSPKSQASESTVPEHWDSEEDAKPESNYLDGSIDTPADETVVEENIEKAQLKIRIPVEEYPGYNFIGRLLGPRGATLKHLEVQSKCRLYIRGRGSLRSSDMGQELAKASLPGFEHLHEDLHVLVEYEGDASERDSCLKIASNLVAPLLVPPPSDEQDELKKQQLKELAILNGTYKENKQLLPVANKRIMQPSCHQNANISNAMGSTGCDTQQHNQHGVGGGHGPSGMPGPHVMMQVMAQQMFLQEQHKMNMRIGMHQAQQAMAARQQVLTGTTNPNMHNNNATGGHINSLQSNTFQHNTSNMNSNNSSMGPMSRPNFPNGGVPANNCNVNIRGRSNQIPANHARLGMVSADSKPFVPNIQRPAVEAQPFVPSALMSQPFTPSSALLQQQQQQQQQERGRSTSQGPPQQRSVSHGPSGQGRISTSSADNTLTPNRGKGAFDKTSKDENWDPQWASAGNGSGSGLTKAPSSPSFLCSMPFTPQQRGNMGYQSKNSHNNFSRCESVAFGNGLDDSVDNGWGPSLPFDLGWEAGDADSSVNTSLNSKYGNRASPPGGRGAQRWHPYSRSPPKASPDFNSKVMAICSASFGGHSGQSGAYSLF